MSVQLYTRPEINNWLKTKAKDENEQRAIWYGYIANITAYNVQYEENIQIDFKDETISIDMEYRTIGGLIYNCYTNAGNCFLADKWMKVLEQIAERDKTE